MERVQPPLFNIHVVDCDKAVIGGTGLGCLRLTGPLYCPGDGTHYHKISDMCRLGLSTVAIITTVLFIAIISPVSH